jgi:hypothetical protein
MTLTREDIQNMECSGVPIALMPDPNCGISSSMFSHIRLMRTVHRKGRRTTRISLALPIKRTNNEAIRKFRATMSKNNL